MSQAQFDYVCPACGYEYFLFLGEESETAMSGHKVGGRELASVADVMQTAICLECGHRSTLRPLVMSLVASEEANGNRE